jgi:hypothetical protein
MGLRHFGQVGGGEFLGMTLTLESGGSMQNSQSPITAEDEAVMSDLKGGVPWLSARFPTQFKIGHC